MPELPEVEVNRQGLNRLVKGKTIKDIQVFWPKIIVGYEEEPAILEPLRGQTIKEVQRRGKYLLFSFKESYLVSHLRMEGKYFYYPKEEVPTEKNKHTHVIFEFNDESQLHYNDVRKFGRMEYLPKEQYNAFFNERKIGPEPTVQDFHIETFRKNLKSIKQKIKPALLSQKLVAGLGNIYVDEVLFEAKIHPETIAKNLSDIQINTLYHVIIQIMEKAIQLGGSTIRSYRNTVGEAGRYQNELKVYGKAGEPCPRCSQSIEKIKVAQRGTHFCPSCQILETGENE